VVEETESVVVETEIALVPKENDADKDNLSEEEAFEEDSTQDKPIWIGTDLEEAALATKKLSLWDRFRQDTVGNTVSVIVLIGMIFSVTAVGKHVLTTSFDLKPWPVWAVPVIVLVGLFVAIYMSYVEVTETQAVCGPIGDCNTVQQSSYALLFGLIPTGVLGIAGYLLIGMAWLLAVSGPERWRKIAVLGCWLLCVFGALFSIYLTFLEPFVIGATCAWCLTSAIVMHLLLWATTAPAIKVWKNQ
jgi:uncharacterized membrane protein